MKLHSALPYQNLPLVQCGMSLSLLKGIRVIDLTTSVAGPYGTMLLSDFGAEVIKVERPEGDDARQWGPPFLNGEALWFTALNRNKKSVVIDMRTPQGAEDFRKLLESADVVVTNQPLDVQRKLKLDYETLKSVRKDLIFVSITGFGLSGERSDLTSYDLIAEGYSGIMDITGEEDSPPQKIGAPAADMLAGQDAAMATMAALFDRQRSGNGRKIEVSLVESMVRFLACRISSYLGSGEVPKRSGGTDSVIAIYQAFDTIDSKITLGLGSNAIWNRFWKAVGDPEYANGPDFRTNAARRVHREAIVKHIQEILLTKSREDWLEIFASARIPAGPINQIDDLAADTALQDRGMIFALQDGTDRIVPQIGLGIRIDDKPCIPRSSPPLLGQHTAEILYGMTEPEVGFQRIAIKSDQGA
jgi:crotonobetainyl-CoA:carnitine CoA-transferase CaiB-like acyl-CoA transferase